MAIIVEANDFEAITEIRSVGPNTIEVSVDQTKKRPQRHRIRITACENIRSGTTSRYDALYEEQITINDIDGNQREVWALASYPWQDGNTVEACLRGALIFVSGG